MASDTGSSIFAPSTTQISTQSQSKPSRGPAPSIVWDHCRTANDTENPAVKYCKHCTDPAYSSSISSNMKKHLQSKHGIVIEITSGRVQTKTLQQLQQLYLKAKSSDQTEEIDTQVFEHYLDQDMIYEALVSLIVVGNLSFRMVERPEFHTFCQLLNPKANTVIPTTHSTIGRKIDQAFQTHKDSIRKKLQSALSSIHLSVDIWTSPNKHLLLGITADFVDCDTEKHTKALLALPTVKGHSGKAQFDVFLPVLNDYGITQKLGAVVGDNSSTNDTLCREIEDHLLEEEDISWDASYWRARCMGHIINLAVQAFLFHHTVGTHELELYDDLEQRGELSGKEEVARKFRLLGPLGKLHNILVHIHSTPALVQEFLGLAGRLIPLDNRTRWNSWYSCLLVANEHQSSIDTFTKSHLGKLEADFITPQDWIKLGMIKDFLQPFHKATLNTQGHHATIDKVLFTMDVLLKYFNIALVSNPMFSRIPGN
jgi:hypothetical protein